MDYKIAQRTLVCAILFALVLMFVGCGNQSFITLTSTESPARDAKAVFELNISGISGAEITTELRQNGESNTQPLISLDNSAKDLAITITPDKQDIDKYNRVNLTASSGDLTRNAMFTDLPEAAGWSFSTQKQNEKLKITAGETKVLAALALDTGNGVRSINLDNIDENNYDCVIIIRAVFN